ncbi:hypothetical protein CEUSTIGMA_g7801.t1 [Chlamydomonas eustigma]|uniref:Uncharacterized protein n=1 Tax=Chlamydomonas eustigma TaxID=1157962 RepID=A0A250XBW2_9CHLO|nr:hypothetical protein CEUSTIGMA_g7801.t1 [Chlamydomonas eustigma]|eukprot:GAX80362.1 hypothetical protein CEUSTIGMA_g7801.t1 [Chlamydomonas eustigma]
MYDISKGFGSIYYIEMDGTKYFMGLYESNYCRTVVPGPDAPGLDRGHGRVILAQKVAETRHKNCSWEVVKIINILDHAKFLDFSAMSFYGYMGSTVAIVSQEDAAVWFGEFDWLRMEFRGKGRILHFPRNEHCQNIYCNYVEYPTL